MDRTPGTHQEVAGEHYVDIVGVTGSIPVAPTTTQTGCGSLTPLRFARDTIQGGHAPSPSWTLSKLIGAYQGAILPRKKPSTQAMEGWVLRAFLRHPLAQVSLGELRRRDFLTYRDERLAEGIKEGSLKRQLDILHHMFEIARDEWELEIENPVVRLKLKPSAKRERRLTLELCEIVNTKGERNPFLKPMILFAKETGMRREEITNIEWSHIQGETLLIPRTKNGEARIIPLTTRAREILQSLRQGSKPFDTTPSAVSQAFRRLIKRAGMKDVHFHDLRHEAISTFFEKDLTLPEVASISGHKDMRMLLRYAHADKRKLLKKLEA